MDDKEKAKYDALQSLNDQSWAEFREKTQLEWRLSFGLWTAMVTAIGSILGSTTYASPAQFPLAPTDNQGISGTPY